MASNETDRDAAVTKETFAEEITSAYNVIANLWIHAKEIKVMSANFQWSENLSVL